MASSKPTATRLAEIVQANECSALMLDVLSLIYAAADLNEGGGVLDDSSSPMTGKERITRLLLQAKAKTEKALQLLDQ